MTDSAPRDDITSGAIVPTWLANLAAVGWRVVAIVALAVVIGYLGSIIWTVLASIGLAVIVAVVLAPVMKRLRDGGRSRSSAAMLAWVATLGIGIGVLLLVGISLIPYVVEVLDRLRAGQAAVDEWAADLQLPAQLTEWLADIITRISGLSGDAVGDFVGSLANLTGILILGSFLLYFFLRDGDKAWAWIFQWLDEAKRERIDSAGDDALSRVGNYVRGTTVMASIASVTNLAFMVVLGTPLGLPLAILTFALAYIPYFGGLASAFVIVLVTWGAEGATVALIMSGMIFARFVLVRLFVRPRVYAQALTLHPVVILISLPIGLQVAGLAGLILAVPLAAVLVSVAQALAYALEPETPRSLPELVPAWLDTAAQWSWRSLIVLAFVGLLVLALATVPLVLLPVIIALILAATVVPLVQALLERGWSRNAAVATAVGGSTVAILGVLILSIASIVEQAEEIAATAVDGAEEADDAADGLLGMGADAVEAGAEYGASAVAELAAGLGPLTLVIILAVLLTFYFLRDGAGLWGAMMQHLPTDAAKELTTAGERAFSVLGGYMVGTGAISLVGAGSQAVIMWVLDLPLVLPVFVLSFFGGFIPYIGSFLTTMLAFLIAVAVGDTIDIIVMLIWTLVFNIVQGNIVAPLVYNRTTHIHPAIVLACIPAGSAIAGILGMFLVVPVLGVVTVSWRSVLRVMGTDLGDPITFDDEEDAGGDELQGQPGSAGAT